MVQRIWLWCGDWHCVYSNSIRVKKAWPANGCMPRWTRLFCSKSRLSLATKGKFNA